MIAKCGTDLLFMNITASSPIPTPFRLDLGSKVELQNVYSTGVEDLL